MESTNMNAIVASAIAQAQQFRGYEHPIVLARVLSGLMVPALKQVSGYNQQPRVYTHPSAMTTAAAIGAQGNATIRFTSNSDFLLTGLSLITGDDGATAYTYYFNLVFGANDRNLVNYAPGIHAQALMGTEQMPWAMPKAFAIRKNSSLNLTITSTTTTAVEDTWCYLFGIDYLDGNVLDATRRSVA